MTEGYAPSDVPLYPDQPTREDEYQRAQADGVPFFAVEQYEEGYALTYDLLPAGSQLAGPAYRELEEQATRTVESIVGDSSLPTAEVGRSIGDSLGNISFFEKESTAREVAAVVSRIVLDETNWVDATPPGDTTPQNRQN